MGMWHQEWSRQQLHTASMCRSPMPLLLPVSPSVTNRNTTQYLQGNWMLMQYWGLVWFLHSHSFDFSILELHSAKYFPNWWNLLPGTLATAFYLQLRKKLTTFALFFFLFPPALCLVPSQVTQRVKIFVLAQTVMKEVSPFQMTFTLTPGIQWKSAVIHRGIWALWVTEKWVLRENVMPPGEHHPTRFASEFPFWQDTTCM